MKFSVLLPTRNRLELLSHAIETVRKQDYSDWEIIVSDNDTEQDIAGYVRSLNDPRIRYFRTDAFLPVTDNWNNALEQSEGDYIVMLGDDDGLMQGYFSTLKQIVENHDAPDFIYTSAFLYAYPGVLPGLPDGFLRTYNNRKIYRSDHNPFWLSKTESEGLARQSLNFRMLFDYNMQFSLVSRKLVDELRQYGAFYQSPYPDYYASNAMMLKAKRVLVVPQPLIAIGISPKSFGFYYFNDLESKGNDFLKNIPEPGMARRLQDVVLPGTDMNTSWLVSMETLARNFGQERDIQVNYKRYRYLQMSAVYAGVVLGKPGSHSALKALTAKMTMIEKVLFGVPLSMVTALARFVPSRYHSRIANLLIRMTGSHEVYTSPVVDGKFMSILDVFEQVSPTSNAAP